MRSYYSHQSPIVHPSTYYHDTPADLKSFSASPHHRYNRDGGQAALSLRIPHYAPRISLVKTPSPSRLPPTPRIRTVNLPNLSPSPGFFADSVPGYLSDSDDSPAQSPTSPAGPFLVRKSVHDGAYASIVIADCATTKSRVCLKVVSKSKVQTRSAVQHSLLTELTVYKIIANYRPNSFIMDCHGVFQDKRHIFLAMDPLYADLHSLLGKELPPNRIKRWVAQMAVGIGFLHEIGIIHRDIKPENTLVDYNDNIRLSDFGTAFICNEPILYSGTYSTQFAGTQQYIAPEMLKGKSYNGSVDFWALGCTVYDLIVGDVLFASPEDMLEYVEWASAGNGPSYLQLKTRLFKEQVDLLTGLLRKNPQKRFNISDLRRHPYFCDDRGFDIFSDVESKSKEPPPCPDLFEEDLQTPTTDPEVIYYPTSKPSRYGADGFFSLNWINPRGLWGSRLS